MIKKFPNGVEIFKRAVISTPVIWHMRAGKGNTLKITFNKSYIDYDAVESATADFKKHQFDYFLSDNMEVSDIKDVILIKK